MNPKTYPHVGFSAGEYHTRFWRDTCSDERFRALGPVVDFAKGAILAQAGRVPRCCYYVLEGRVMAFEYTLSTGDRYYNFNEEGSLLLESNVLLEKAPPVSFVAVSAVKAVTIERERLMARLREDPTLAEELLMSLSYKFLAAMDQVREGTQYNVAWKVCNLLLTFAERYGVEYDGKILIKEKISQQMLANLLGVNRITMVRTVKELREQSLIEQVNGFYCIRDRERMLEYMEEASASLR